MMTTPKSFQVLKYLCLCMVTTFTYYGILCGYYGESPEFIVMIMMMMIMIITWYYRA